MALLVSVYSTMPPARVDQLTDVLRLGKSGAAGQSSVTSAVYC